MTIVNCSTLCELKAVDQLQHQLSRIKFSSQQLGSSEDRYVSAVKKYCVFPPRALSQPRIGLALICLAQLASDVRRTRLPSRPPPPSSPPPPPLPFLLLLLPPPSVIWPWFLSRFAIKEMTKGSQLIFCDSLNCCLIGYVAYEPAQNLWMAVLNDEPLWDEYR